jgi:histidinol dehydrogenase
MRIIRNAEEGRRTLLARRPLEIEELPMEIRETTFRTFGQELAPDEVVRRIIRDVREDGDNAVRYYNSAIDGAHTPELRVQPDEIRAAYETLPAELIEALRFAAERVRRYHETQLRGASIDFQQHGLGQVTRPIQRAGIYVPAPAPRSPAPS